MTPPTQSPSVAKTSPKSLTKPATAARGPEESRPTVPRMEARSATSTAGGGSSDLIDFIRTGPISPGERRIPLPVAPFQDPVELDQSEAHSSSINGTDSIHDGRSLANRSYTSFGSNTALLDSKDTSSSSAGARTPVQQTPSPSSSATKMQSVTRPATAQRKQLQARDPYIIDDDDDDDDDDDYDDFSDLLGAPKKKKQPKESLMDFLNNVPPPPEQNPQPFLSNAAPSKPLLKGSSSPPKPGMLNKKLSKASVRGENSYTQVSKPSLAPAKTDYKQTPSVSTTGRPSPVSAGTAKRSSPRTRETETSALADFLKNTGPPEPVPVLRGYTSTSITAGKDKSSSSNPLGKLFGRRKKVEA